jgi:hypothetical protein
VLVASQGLRQVRNCLRNEECSHLLNLLTERVRYMSFGEHVCVLQRDGSGTVCVGDAVFEGIG